MRTLQLETVDIRDVPVECAALTNSGPTGSMMRRALESASNERRTATTAIIARIEGEVVGWATWWIIKAIPDTGMQDRAIVGVFVAEERRRQGIGVELVRDVVAAAAVEGATLVADPWDAAGRAFYASLDIPPLYPSAVRPCAPRSPE